MPGIIINLEEEEAETLRGYGLHRGIINENGTASDVAKSIVGDLIASWRENSWRSGVTPEGEAIPPAQPE